MKFILILISIFYFSFFNIHSLATETKKANNILKIGLILPLSGEKKEIGKSILNSLRIALSKINDSQIEIFPRDNYSNPEKTLLVAKQLEKEGIQIVIGPIFHQNLIYLEEIKDVIFLSLSNKTKKIPKNVITIGINANSQLNAIINFLKKKKLDKPIVLIPKSDYENELKNVLSNLKYNFLNIYSYDVEPNKLTSQIRQITSYEERKKNLERRMEILEKSETYKDKEELDNLKTKYTLGEVDFDSVIIADFGENLKSVTNSFLFSDVTTENVKFITLNQWFDKTLLKESSINEVYFPSIKLINYYKFRENYFKNYNMNPSQIAILAYDIVGLIYHLKKTQGNDYIKSFFDTKKTYVGELGEFSFKNKIVEHKLNMYQVLNSKFVEIRY